jgi:hypothetical protein
MLYDWHMFRGGWPVEIYFDRPGDRATGCRFAVDSWLFPRIPTDFADLGSRDFAEPGFVPQGDHMHVEELRRLFKGYGIHTTPRRHAGDL